MNIFLNNQIQRNQTLLDILFGRKVRNTKTNKNVQSGGRNTITISREAQELSMRKSISGRSRNISVDSTINLQKYIDAARESNSAEEVIPYEEVINFEWLYGKMEQGRYRIVKTITDFRGTGDYTDYAFTAEFSIE